MFFQHLAQGSGSAGAGFAVAFGDFGFHRRQHRQHRLGGLLAQRLALRRVQFGFGRLGLLFAFRRSLSACCPRGCGGCRGFHHFTTQGAQLIGPHQHLRQGCGGIGMCGRGLRQSGFKSLPDTLQLAARSVQLGRELHVHAGPAGLFGQGLGLLLPLGHIGLQCGMHRLGFFPALGGQDFHTLRQQDRSFALHHHLVLQVVHGFHHFGQLHLEAGQGLARQRGAGFGGITLPSQGIGNVEAGTAQ